MFGGEEIGYLTSLPLSGAHVRLLFLVGVSQAHYKATVYTVVSSYTAPSWWSSALILKSKKNEIASVFYVSVRWCLIVIRTLLASAHRVFLCTSSARREFQNRSVQTTTPDKGCND